MFIQCKFFRTVFHFFLLVGGFLQYIACYTCIFLQFLTLCFAFSDVFISLKSFSIQFEKAVGLCDKRAFA